MSEEPLGVEAEQSRPIGSIEATARRLLRTPKARGPLRQAFHTFLLFGVKQAWVCLFGGLMLLLLLGTHRWYPSNAWLPRYDALTLAAIAIQIVFIRLKLEEWSEVKVILLFHLAGTGMELFKTAVGSWTYPEFAYLRLGGVPLFSGFMYASVGSYITRSCRGFDLRFTGHPRLWVTLLLSAAIYGNFFLHHYWLDLRYLIVAGVLLAFGRCWIYFRVDVAYHRLPFLVSFFLIAGFLWVAENVGTYSHAWVYPAQAQGWRMVSFEKLGSWFLLTIMSYVMVTVVNPPLPPETVLSPEAFTGAPRPVAVASKHA